MCNLFALAESLNERGLCLPFYTDYIILIMQRRTSGIIWNKINRSYSENIWQR